MISMLFLKGLSDLGFIYAIFSFVFYILKINRLTFFAGWALQAIAYSLSFQLKDKGLLRYLPFALSLLPLLADSSSMNLVFLLPGMVYGIYYAKDGAYYLDREHQVTIFSRFWVIAAAEGFGLLVMGELEILGEWLIPLSLIVVSAQILLMRALRHDPVIYLSPKYQLTDLGVMAAMAAVVSIISSDIVRKNVLGTIKFFYFTVVVPILMVIIRIVAQLIAWVVVPIGRLMKNNQIENSIQIGASDVQELMQREGGEYDPDMAERIRYILIGLGILIAVGIIIVIFQALSPSRTDRRKPSKTTISRSFSQNRRSGAPVEGESEASAQVRARYRSFLKLYSKMHLPWRRASTSMDIEEASLRHFDNEALKRMREIYIAARYNNSATEAEAEEARTLLKTLKDTAE
jgi:hypothetical protein